MTKIYNSLVLVLIVLFFASCNKDAEELNVNLNESANFRLTLTTKSGDPIPEQGVSLYTGGTFIDFKLTDENGVIDFGELLTQEYQINVPEVVVDGVEYNVYQYMQIIAGSNKEMTIIPEEYVSTIEITFLENSGSPEYNLSPLTDLNVALISYENLENANTLDRIKELAFQIIKTDANGLVKFTDIPSNVSYRAVYYLDQSSQYFISDYMYSQKGEILKDNIQITFNKAVLNFADYNDVENISGVNAMLIRYSDFYDLESYDVTSFKSVALQEKVSDNNGEITFDRLFDGSYVTVYYFNENDYRTIEFYVYNGETENLNIDVYDVNIQVYNNSGNGGSNNVNVVYISSDYYYSLDYDQRDDLDLLIAGALSSPIKTDTNGQINLDNSLFYGRYYFIAYTDDRANWDMTSGYSYNNNFYIYIN